MAALDLLFLYPLDMGIGGAAWASVIATAAALREFTRGLLFDLGGKLQPFVLELG